MPDSSTGSRSAARARAGSPAAIARAYNRGCLQGSLLRIMDATERLSQTMHVGNSGLPRDFHATVTACRGQCVACGYRAELSASLIVQGRTSLEKDS